jgi:prolyl oligopeptidase
MTPAFVTSWLCFVQHFNGVAVQANIRGGNEYGEEWHKAGCFANKQNVFDDFQVNQRLFSTYKFFLIKY